MDQDEGSGFSPSQPYTQDSTNLTPRRSTPNLLATPEQQEEPPKRRSMDFFRFGSSKSDSKRVSSAPPFEVKRASSHGGHSPQPTPEFAMTVTDTTSSVSVNTTTRTTKKSLLSVPKSPFRPGSPSLFKSRRHAIHDDDRDELPTNPAKLDGVINFHLGELDRLKREIEYHTELLTQLSYTLGDISRREGMQVSTRRMQKRMQDIFAFRTSLGKIVGYHRFELERVAELKRMMGEVNNVRVKIPDA